MIRCFSRASSLATSCVSGRPWGEVRMTRGVAPARCARIASTAAKNGSTFMTMPAPPPYGASSTWRWRSVVKSRRSQTRTSSSPRSRARPITLTSRGRKASGKIVTMSILIQPSGLSLSLEETRHGMDNDAPGGGIDAHDDGRDRRDENLPPRAVDGEDVVGRRADHFGDHPERLLHIPPPGHTDDVEDEVPSRRQHGGRRAGYGKERLAPGLDVFRAIDPGDLHEEPLPRAADRLHPDRRGLPRAPPLGLPHP